jgi:hypothetical protein
VDDPDEPGFTEPPHSIVSRTDPRRLYAVIAVLLVVIVVLAIRPWGGDGGPPREGNVAQPSAGRPASATPPPDASAGAEPTPGAVAAGLDETCGSPSGWRAATLQDWAGRSTPIRSWIAIEPVTASGAADPAVPFAPVATGIVTAIGYCAPLGDAERPPAASVASLWAVRDGQAIPLSLLPLEPSSPDALGGLWRRPPEVTDEPVAPGQSPTVAPADVWPPGRYVVELAAPGGDYHRWLGIEIADLSLLRASAVPPSAAAPSPSSDPSSAPAAPSSASPAP